MSHTSLILHKQLNTKQYNSSEVMLKDLLKTQRHIHRHVVILDSAMSV